ncbi:MAG: helix-turn-helix domain-containing protein, partial [Bacteroidetes bacterium]|nr:helix-turn-helix domain-containing protein [Bacteroidota bacterium]
IKYIHDDKITVSFANNDELVLAKETWNNVRYTYHKEKNSIDEEQLGSFTQYPIRLAWAITIHKSQGLTFDKAIIDAGGSFAAGQVYVALSRCTSLEGMVLLSRIQPRDIATDQRVVTFSAGEAGAEELHELLLNEQQDFMALELVKLFDWKRIIAVLRDWVALVPEKKLPDTGSIITLSTNILRKAEAQSIVAAKFQTQLSDLIAQAKQSGDTALLRERTAKAIGYFAKAISEELLQPLDIHADAMKHASKVKKYLEEVKATAGFIRQHLQKLINAAWGEMVFFPDADLYRQYLPEKATATVNTPAGKAARQKAEKAEKAERGASQRESLALFRKGNDLNTIANLRNLAVSTVYSHLAVYVRSGELDIHELISKERVDIILPVIKEVGGYATGPMKQRLGNDFSWEEIRLVLNHWQYLQEQLA